MPDPLKIAILADTKGARHYLEEIVLLMGYALAESGEKTPSLRIEGQHLKVQDASLSLPSKAHTLISAIRNRLERQSPSERIVEIGTYTFDAYDFLLTDKSGENIRLTEKEAAILLCLQAASGGIVGRQTLLDEVWGYAQNVETHTLETHIYRLRQKIEADPSNPQILKTEEDGYALAL